ncbi:MAG: hypothetical protein ACREEB_16275 [Caulobacteraceae bacterium]
MTPDQAAVQTAFATWGGAIATFVAAVVALWIAVTGARRDDRLRRQEHQDRQRAAGFALKYALEHLVNIFEENDAHPHANLKKSSLAAKLNAAMKGVEQALVIDFTSADLLKDALNTHGSIGFMISAISGWDNPNSDIPIAYLTDSYGPLRQDIEASYERHK